MTPLETLKAELSHRDELIKTAPMRWQEIKVQDCLSALVDYEKCKWVPASVYSERADAIRAFLVVTGYATDRHNKVTLTNKGLALIGREVAA